MLKQCNCIFFILFLFANLFGDDTKGIVHQIKITTDKAPDTSSLKSIVESVTKGLKTNDEKAVAIYNYLIYNNYHLQYPKENGGVAVIKELNVYGWSLCGGLHTLQAALWKELGWKWRYVGWSGHTTVEAFYDDNWHFLDVFMKFYTWRDDPKAPNGRTIASQEDILKNPSIVLDKFVYDSNREVWYMKGNELKNINGKANWTAPAFLMCKDKPIDVVDGVKTKSVQGSPEEWAGIKFREDGYSTDVDLLRGTKLTMLWSPIAGSYWWFPDRKRSPAHTCSERDFRNSPSLGLIIEPYRQVYKTQGRSYSNGRLSIQPIIDSSLLSLFDTFENLKVEGKELLPIDVSKPASFVLRIESPYVMSTGNAIITDVTSAEISVDGGKSFKMTELNNISNAIGGAYSILMRVPVAKAITNIDIEIIVQQNYRALPYLSPGKNEVTIALNNPAELKENRLVITYAFRPGFKNKTFEDYVNEGKELAKSHNTEWSKQLFIVQKTLKASDFKNGKYVFNIDIGTPKGKQPAYPQMVFLKREILGVNEQPEPLPEGSVAFESVPDSEMMTLPYPFHMDLIAPEVEKPRNVKVEKLKAEFGFAVQDTGAVAENHYVKVKQGENWNILVKADISSLKDSNSFKAVKLALPIIRSIDQASVKIGAFGLAEPYEMNKPYDFKKIGAVVGTVIIPKQPEGKSYSPAQYFSVDVTGAVKKSIQEGKKEVYLAITTIPDKAVDDGYTTRVDFDSKAEFYLESEIFSD